MHSHCVVESKPMAAVANEQCCGAEQQKSGIFEQQNRGILEQQKSGILEPYVEQRGVLSDRAERWLSHRTVGPSSHTTENMGCVWWADCVCTCHTQTASLVHWLGTNNKLLYGKVEIPDMQGSLTPSVPCTLSQPHHR